MSFNLNGLTATRSLEGQYIKANSSAFLFLETLNGQQTFTYFYVSDTSTQIQTSSFTAASVSDSIIDGGISDLINAPGMFIERLTWPTRPEFGFVDAIIIRQPEAQVDYIFALSAISPALDAAPDLVVLNSAIFTSVPDGLFAPGETIRLSSIPSIAQNLIGTDGADVLTGGAGTDWISPGLGNDTVDGAGGQDVVFYEDVQTGVFVNISNSVRDGIAPNTAVAPSLFVDSLANIENFHLTSFNDDFYSDQPGGYIFLRAGDDKIQLDGVSRYIIPGSGNDTIIGDPLAPSRITYDADRYDAAGPQISGIQVQFNGQTTGVVLNDGWGDVDTFIGVNAIEGSQFDDFMQGDGGDEYLAGGVGNDTLDGGGGRDELHGGDGNDTITASGPAVFDEDSDQTAVYDGAGDDEVVGVANGGGLGIDIIVGSGNDIFRASGDALGGERLRFEEYTYEGPRRQDVVVRFETETTGTIENDGFGGEDKFLGFNRITGSDRNDTFFGADGRQRLEGRGGDDTIYGMGGDDRLIGGDGNDELYGGDGDDRLEGGTGDNVVMGGGGWDTYRLNDADGHTLITDYESGERIQFDADRIGFDVDHLTSEITTEYNGAADQTKLYVQSATVARHHIATVNGEFLVASREYDARWDEVNVQLIERVDGAIMGTFDNDEIFGSDASDVIYGLSGNDIIDGGEGDDTICGGSGADWIQGGLGNDSIDGGEDEDVLIYSQSIAAINLDSSLGIAQVGSSEVDSFQNIEAFVGSEHNDTLLGRDTDTRVAIELNAITGDVRNYEQFRGGKGDDFIDGRGGYDEISYTSSLIGLTIDLNSTTQSDGLGGIDQVLNIEGVEGTPFDDYIYGNEADNSLDGRFGSNLIDGRGGYDFVEYNGSERHNLTVDLSAGIATFTRGAYGDTYTDTLSSIEGVIGSRNNDYIKGDQNHNKLYGVDGNDTIFGGVGNDSLYGGAGDDLIYGGDGDDFLDGGAGDDELYGGAGDDTLVQSGSGSQLYDGGDGTDTFLTDTDDFNGVYVPKPNFSGLIDLVAGFSGVEENPTNPLNDVVRGVENVTTRGEWNWEVIGDSKDNVIQTGRGDDKLYGGVGSDTLEGGAGSDTLTGGEGSDTFVFRGTFDHDVITDFNEAEDSLEFYAADGSEIATSKLIESTDSSGSRVLSTSDGLSSVTFETTVDVTTTVTDRFGNVLSDVSVSAYEVRIGEHVYLREVGTINTSTVFEIVAKPTEAVSSIDFDLIDNVGLVDFQVGTALSGWSLQTNTSTPDVVQFAGFGAVNGSQDLLAGQEVVLATFETSLDPDFVIDGIFLNTTAQADISVGEVVAVSEVGNVTVHQVARGSDVYLDADKPIDDASDRAITANDALQALRLAVGLTKSDGKAEWHDFIAADINQDGQVTANDALNILKFAVGLTEGPSADWVFVDGDADWSAIGRRNTSYEEGVWLEDVVADMNVNMTGILVGDVNGSYFL